MRQPANPLPVCMLTLFRFLLTFPLFPFAIIPSPFSRSFPITGSQFCRLTYHMFQSCEPRTCDLFVTRHSHSFAIRIRTRFKRMPKVCLFFFSLSLSIKLRSQPFKPHLQPLPLDHRGLMHQCLPPPNTVKFFLSAITRGRRLVLCYRFNKKSKYGERSPINFNWLTDPRIII